MVTLIKVGSKFWNVDNYYTISNFFSFGLKNWKKVSFSFSRNKTVWRLHWKSRGHTIQTSRETSKRHHTFNGRRICYEIIWLVLTPSSVRQMTTTTMTIVSGLNMTAGWWGAAANDSTGAGAVDVAATASVVRLVTNTVITICKCIYTGKRQRRWLYTYDCRQSATHDYRERRVRCAVYGQADNYCRTTTWCAARSSRGTVAAANFPASLSPRSHMENERKIKNELLTKTSSRFPITTTTIVHGITHTHTHSVMSLNKKNPTHTEKKIYYIIESFLTQDEKKKITPLLYTAHTIASRI